MGTGIMNGIFGPVGPLGIFGSLGPLGPLGIFDILGAAILLILYSNSIKEDTNFNDIHYCPCLTK
jgi:hypothetical protein